MTTLALPTFEDVRAAAQRLHGHAHRTPVLRSATLDQQLGAQVGVAPLIVVPGHDLHKGLVQCNASLGINTLVQDSPRKSVATTLSSV